MFYDSNHADITCLAIDGVTFLQQPVHLMPRPVHACPRRLAGALLAGALGLASAGVRAQAPAAAPAAIATPTPPAAAAPSAGTRAAPTAAGAALERSVKAAFLYKFLGYTEFPASAFAEPGSPVVIGVLGADELAAELTRIVSGRSVLGRQVVVKLIKDNDAPANVHLLFIGGADGSRTRSILRLVKDAPMLVVTEADDGLQSGSVINFKIVDERVRFDVSLEAADKNSVKLSSRLLTVANQVHKGAP